MRPNPVKTAPASPDPTRREVLGTAALAALGMLAPSTIAQIDERGESSPQAASRPSQPWWLGPRYPSSQVVEVRSTKVLHGSFVESQLLGDMLDQGVRRLTLSPSPEIAWRAILGKAQRIAIKFNSVGAALVGTNEVFGKVLLNRLEAAGYAADTIALIEAPELMQQPNFRSVARGWSGGIHLDGHTESLANYLLEADAVINVPLLKTHQIAGMAGCMNNISHAVIRRPARYHANACSPYVGQVIAHPEVSSRLRLHLMNALRIVVDRGPEATDADVANWGGLLIGFDPVAVDFVGRSVLEAERRRRSTYEQFDVPYLVNAADSGIGRWRPGELDRVVVAVDR